MSAPAVAVSRDGKKYGAAWKDVRSGPNAPQVYWSIADSPAFADDAPIDFAPRAKQDHPSLAFDSTGNAWAVWEHTQSGRTTIRARSSGVSTARAVSDPNEGDAAFPVIAANGGIIAVAYEVGAHGRAAVRLRRIETRQK